MYVVPLEWYFINVLFTLEHSNRLTFIENLGKVF